jgi:hypothetical protein
MIWNIRDMKDEGIQRYKTDQRNEDDKKEIPPEGMAACLMSMLCVVR